MAKATPTIPNVAQILKIDREAAGSRFRPRTVSAMIGAQSRPTTPTANIDTAVTSSPMLICELPGRRLPSKPRADGRRRADQGIIH